MRPTVTLHRVGTLLRRAHGPRRQIRRRDNPLDWIIRAALAGSSPDQHSERTYATLRFRFPSYEDLRRASLRSLMAAIRCGGQANLRAVRIKALLDEIWTEQGHYDLSFLRDLSDEEVRAYLGRFKGIGSRTTALVLLLGLGRSAFPVDSDIFRVCRRIGLLDGQRSPEAAQAYLEPRVPAGEQYALHLLLAAHGREVCRTQRPRCGECVLASLCVSRRV